MKTKTAVLNGKPDAGNPHVRFDEGEVASYPPTVATRGAKPRRGSLLYKTLKLLAAVAVVCGFAAEAVGAWTLAGDSKSITDGNWTLKVTTSGTTLSVTGVTSVDDATTLDLSASVEGVYAIVSVSSIATTTTKAGLQSLILPATLTTIGNSAFSGCTALKTVTPFLPASLTSIGSAAFENCPIETPLVLSNPGLTTIPENVAHGVFLKSCFIKADLSGSGITSIGKSAFQNNTALTEVLLPETLASLGNSAFAGCTALKTVTPFLPASVTSIGSAVFEDCPIETPLVLSNPGLTTISDNVAHGVFKGARFPTADLSKSGLTTTGISNFRENTALTTVILPQTLTTVAANVFYGCSELCDVTFLSSLPTFGTDAFRGTVSDYKGRIRYPVTDPTWKGAGDSYTAWDDVAPANKAIYEAAFPDETTPAGVAKFASNCKFKCLVPIVEDVGDRVDVIVRGEPVEVGSPDPGYGTHEDVGDTISGSVSQDGDDGRIWYVSKGYRIDVSSPTGWIPGEEVLGARTVAQKVSEGGIYGLVWLWETNGYQVAATGYNSDYGSVTQTAADYGDDFYEPGKAVTLTAVPVGGVTTFGGWYGDVPAGQENNATITVVADRAKTLVPYFPTAGWTYDSTAKTISDGYWTLKTSGSADALTVTGIATSPDGLALLDLTRPVDGGTIVAIGDSAFKDKPLTDVRLPATLTTIGEAAFRDCKSLRSVTPFLPATLTSIGAAAFENCPIVSPLVLSNPELTTIPKNVAHGVFKGSRFLSVDLSGSGITLIGQSAFQGNTALTEVFLPETLTSLGDSAFSGCTALTNVVPFLPAAVTSIGSAVFENCPIETPLVLSNPGLTTISDNVAHGVFKGARFPTADLSKSGLTTTGISNFRENTALTTVVLPPTLTTLGDAVFYGCSKLCDVTFLSPLPTFGTDAFRDTIGGCQGRIRYSAADPTWVAFIAASIESGALKPWKSADVSQAERDAYLAVFPATPKPVGRMSIGGSMKWIVPVAGVGTRIIFR